VTPSEAAKVLAVAVTFDSRLTPPSREDSIARAQAWSLALDERMTEQEAIRLVIDHYRESSDSLMPASLNKAYWRSREAGKERAITSDALDDHRRAMEVAVPMPPEIKQQIHRLIHRKVP
jgi:hypothetical protein